MIDEMARRYGCRPTDLLSDFQRLWIDRDIFTAGLEYSKNNDNPRDALLKLLGQ